MFPAYSANDSAPANAIEYKPDESGTARQQAEWLKNQSFNQIKIKKEDDNDVEFISYFEHKDTTKEEEIDKQQRKKKHKKKEKKAKKKKRKHSPGDESDSSIDIQMEELLCDRNYLEFFAKITPDQLKKAYFFEDLPGLTYIGYHLSLILPIE